MGEDERPPRPGKPAESMWAYLNLGAQLAATVGVFVGLGLWLDRRYGCSPWALLVCGVLGVAAALYQFLRETLKGRDE
ncbi:MAG: AtpZ/AtpI family protein [Planctomycetota bacterium]|nr:AtpZ/AtpI family protein [Planctomycetota bacterium]